MESKKEMEIEGKDGKPIGSRTHNDASDYSEVEHANNGISTFEERAGLMHLTPLEVNKEEVEKMVTGKKAATINDKTDIVEKFLEDCGTSLNELKNRIAYETLDMKGNLSTSYTLVLRIFREDCDIITDLHQDGGTDGYDDHERFWFEFPLNYYRDLPSGHNIDRCNDGTYKLLDEDGDPIEKVEKKDLESRLVDDLIEQDEGYFSSSFDEKFVEKLYDWINEPEEEVE